MTRPEAERRVIEAARNVVNGKWASFAPLYDALRGLDALPADDGWRPISELPVEKRHGNWARVTVEEGALYGPDDGPATHYLLFPSPPDDGDHS